MTPPLQVVKSVQEEFSLSITCQPVESHDPMKANGRKLAHKWGELFTFTGEQLQKELSTIPIANKAYRLRSLDRMATEAEGRSNYAMTAQLLEQAARECGDAYVNRKKR